jgi:DNA-binding beta-propeller fold protein YncE
MRGFGSVLARGGSVLAGGAGLARARRIAALGAASCAAVGLVLAGGTASGSAAALPAGSGPVEAGHIGGVPIGVVRTEPSRLGRARPQVLRDHGNAVQSGPSRRGGFVVLTGSPGAPAVNQRTGTLYVPIQCTTSFCNPNKAAHVVDVISTTRCNVKARSECRVVARARVGSSPLAAAVDQRTDTVYVTNGNSSTVSVLNGARCNATVTRGCGRPVATVKVGKLPVAAAINRATRTLYVANLNGRSVSVINAATCNAKTTRGCRAVRTIRVKAGPAWIDTDLATDTVYVANGGASGNGHTVSVINGAACNGRTGRGCHRVPPTVKVGSGPFGITVDQAADTVYVPSSNDGTVSVINGARCNARTTAGCHLTPPTVTTGGNPQFVVADQSRHTVFTLNSFDNTLSAINTRTCNGAVTSGCRKTPRSEQAAAPDQGPGYDPFPNVFALTPRTGTAYVTNIGGRNILSVTSIRRCSAVRTAGCRRPAPSRPEHEFLMTVDPATNTIYAGNLGQAQIDVLNGATCHAGQLSHCAPVAEIPMADPQANVGSIDHATHTLYASDPFSDSVSVINTATCNARHTAGCAARPPTITVGAAPGPPAFNPVTRTLYVPFGENADQVAVVNAATCNAADTSGCGQSPAVVKVGMGTFDLAVSPVTDTVYAPATGPSFSGDTVAVINGATCRGTDHSGCGHLAATLTAGTAPLGVAVNDRTHTVYVVNNGNGDVPGTISVINGATCNGTDTTGCARRFRTMATGRAPVLAAVDTRTGTLYVTASASASVSILKGSRCNAIVTSGCGRAPREQAVGSDPGDVIINPDTRTVYVASTFQAGSISILRAAR